MRILAIETSCDDTCVAILKARSKTWASFKILSNLVSSQIEIHKKWGGVWPYLAKREHQKNLPLILEKAIKEAGKPKLDLISVTVGPGLEPCLWVGINFAKKISRKEKLPLVPVNHIEAHILANLIEKKSKAQIQNLIPAVCLVVSGGHTQLILMREWGEYKILGETRDDAAGECFDKTARILKLGYPGGPIIAKFAEEVKETDRKKFPVGLPRPMIDQKNYDFSFSGLKTAVLYNFKNQSDQTRKSKKYIRAMAFEIQQAIIDVLIQKTVRAAKNFKVKSVMLGGGVAANNELRKQFQKTCRKNNFKFMVPDPKYCTDNAAMVAVTGYFRWLKKDHLSKKRIRADSNLRIG